MKLETEIVLATRATKNRANADFNPGNFSADYGFSRYEWNNHLRHYTVSPGKSFLTWKVNLRKDINGKYPCQCATEVTRCTISIGAEQLTHLSQAVRVGMQFERLPSLAFPPGASQLLSRHPSTPPARPCRPGTLMLALLWVVAWMAD